MTILQEITRFTRQFGKVISVNGTNWHYYCLGSGPPIFWLTGGLRRAALGFAFMERLAATHTVVTPDYPPVQTINEFFTAFKTILQTENINTFTLGGQSYGGLLAQAYLADKPNEVETLILSSTGPADYGKAWLPIEYIFINLARLLPEKTVKNLLAKGLFKIITVQESVRVEWREAIDFLLRNELSRADVISHFTVATDLIRQGIITPTSYQSWTGRIIVLSAENDPTQSKKDILRYEKLFGRGVDLVNMGNMGHTTAFFDPNKFVERLEQALH